MTRHNTDVATVTRLTLSPLSECVSVRLLQLFLPPTFSEAASPFDFAVASFQHGINHSFEGAKNNFKWPMLGTWEVAMRLRPFAGALTAIALLVPTSAMAAGSDAHTPLPHASTATIPPQVSPPNELPRACGTHRYYDPKMHKCRWNPQRSRSTIRLWNFDPPHRRRKVAP